MSKNKIYIIVFLICLISVNANSDLTHQIIKVSLNGNVDLNFKDSNSRVEYFKADLSLLPKDDYNQQVLDLLQAAAIHHYN